MKEIESQTNDASAKIYKLIRASGFSVYKDTKSLTASRLWVNFKQFICDKYAVEFKKKRINDNKTANCFIGLSMATRDQILELNNETTDSYDNDKDNLELA